MSFFTLLWLPCAVFAFTMGTLRISGFVLPSASTQVTTDGGEIAYEQASGPIGAKIATVVHMSNASGGYEMRISSENDGKLVSTPAGLKPGRQLAQAASPATAAEYQITDNSMPIKVTKAERVILRVGASSRPQTSTHIFRVRINRRLAGVSDTLRLSILAH